VKNKQAAAAAVGFCGFQGNEGVMLPKFPAEFPKETGDSTVSSAFVAPSCNQSVDVDRYGYANSPPPLATGTIYRRLNCLIHQNAVTIWCSLSKPTVSLAINISPKLTLASPRVNLAAP
jgi:hypothetical protein